MNQRTAAITFWCVIVVYCTAWTLLPSLLLPGYRLDVPEMSFVGKEWVIGYHKHPPFQTWILRVVELITCRAHFAPYIASQLCVAACFWAAWRTARMCFREDVALLATFSMVGYYFYAYETTQYNNHVPMMACSSLAVYFLASVLQDNRWRWWIATGAAIGCGMLCKYPMVFLAVSMVAFMFWDRHARTLWRTPGPYLTIIVAALVYFLWLVSHNFSPLAYATKHFHNTRLFGAAITLNFCAANVGILLPIVASLLPLTLFRWRPHFASEDARRVFSLIAFTSFGVCTIFLILGVVKNVNLSVMFSAPIWTMFGVFWGFGIRPEISETQKRLAVVVMTTFAAVMLTVLFIVALVLPYYKEKQDRFLFPTRELARIADTTWATYYGDAPCPFVTGEWWLAGNAAMQMKSDPRVYAYDSSDLYTKESNAHPLSSWATIDDVCKRGGLFFWNVNNYAGGTPPLLHEEYPNAIIVPPVTLRYHRTQRKVEIGIAIIPPLAQ
ncbi:MAG: glycosyltransferase family 39 protein [Thermoguttaceae bacterium]